MRVATESVSQMANSMALWIACGAAIALVVVQAVIFLRNSYSAGREIGLADKQMKGAMKSAAITSIGPSIVILSGMLSLLVSVGGPMAWMRLGLIGSVMFESMAAGFGTASVGVSLGADPMTELAFTMAVWTMILGSIGWAIFATLTANRMDRIQEKLSGGNAAMLTVIASSAIIGSFSAMSADHLVRLNKNSLACILGGVMMFILVTLADKKQIKWLNEWALTFSILFGMIVTAIV